MWSVEKANEWYKNTGWVMGFNYLPATAVNSTEMWQSESYDAERINKELAVAADTGFNSCRVFLQFLVWDKERDDFINTFENFLSIAKKHGISVMPILFDDCSFSNKEPYLGKQQDPVPGVHNSGWTASPGFTIADDPSYTEVLEEYVKIIMKTFNSDKRILMWDMYNEPGNSGRGKKSLQLLYYAFKWSREINPVHPLTTGVWEWKSDWDTECLSLSDIISYHDYEPIEISTKRVDTLKKYERPVFCTEWLHRQNKNTFSSHLEFYKENNISIYNWGLVEGKTQTYLSWNRENNTNDGYPDIWQHDLFYFDLTPHDPAEIEHTKLITSIKYYSK